MQGAGAMEEALPGTPYCINGLDPSTESLVLTVPEVPDDRYLARRTGTAVQLKAKV